MEVETFIILYNKNRGIYLPLLYFRYMKKIIEKAKQYESKKSLDGKMKFLKGNVGKIKLPVKKK